MATYQLYYTDPITGFSVFQKDTPKGKEYKINVKTKKIPVFSDFLYVFTDNKNIKNVKTDTGKIVTQILFEIVSPTPLMAEKQFFEEVSQYLQSIGYIDFSKAAASTPKPSAPQSSSVDVNKIKKGDLFLNFLNGKFIEINSIDNSLGIVWFKETGTFGGTNLGSQFKDVFQDILNNELTPFEFETGQVFVNKSNGNKIEIKSILAKNVEFDWAGTLSYKPQDELVSILIEAGYELQAPAPTFFDIDNLQVGDVFLKKTNGSLVLVQRISRDVNSKKVSEVDLRYYNFNDKTADISTITDTYFDMLKSDVVPFDFKVGQVFENEKGNKFKILSINGVEVEGEIGAYGYGKHKQERLSTINYLIDGGFRLRENPQEEIPQQIPQEKIPPTTNPSITNLEIDALKKELDDLLFLKNITSDINFEQKVNISNEIFNTQKKIDELKEKLFEQRVGDDNFFDTLFEQSFTELKSRYDLDIVKNESSEFISPSGDISDLDENMTTLVKSQAFIDWFGDWKNAFNYRNLENFGGIDVSKVLSEKFEPLLVWHGTNNEFSSFKFDDFPVIYFAKNKEYSEFFATNKGEEGYILPFFLKINNPLDLSIFGQDKVSTKDFFDWMYLKTGMSPEELGVNPLFLEPTFEPHPTWVFIRNNPTMLKKIADGKVYDGIKFYEYNPNLDPDNVKGYNPNVPSDIKKAYETLAYVIFDPHQAKLADPNRGEILLAALKSFMLKRGGKI